MLPEEMKHRTMYYCYLAWVVYAGLCILLVCTATMSFSPQNCTSMFIVKCYYYVSHRV